METSHIHHTRKHLSCSAVLLLTHASSISCRYCEWSPCRNYSLTVREVESLDDSVEIRGFNLKQKLKARYPLLQFLKTIKRNSSEIVFCKEGFSLLADRWTSQSDLVKMESTDCEYDSEGKGPQLGSDYHCQVVESCTLLVNILRESSLTHQR